MQDVCISFWTSDGKHDAMVKVTDICSTDPSDASYCETPNDIKLDRKKVEIVEKDTATHTLPGTEYPDPIFWWFVKCWAEFVPFFPFPTSFSRACSSPSQELHKSHPQY